MTRRKVPEPPPTEWDAADKLWKAEHAEGTAPESLALPFEEPPIRGTVLRETQRELDVKLDAQEQRFNASVNVPDSFAHMPDTSLPVEVAAPDGVAVSAAMLRDSVLAVIDCYVARCLDGSSLSLGEVRELRARVAGL